MLEANNISKHFPSPLGKEYFVALDNVSVYVGKNEWIGIVGESGSGKTTLIKVIMQMIKSDAGEVKFEGENIKDLRQFYRRVQMVFQNPLSSFSPKMTIASYVMEPLSNYNICEKTAMLDVARDLLRDVGLDADTLDRYPHELS